MSFASIFTLYLVVWGIALHFCVLLALFAGGYDFITALWRSLK